MKKHPIGLWLSADDFDRLDRKAMDAKLPISTYARLLVLAALDAGVRPTIPVGPLRQPGRREKPPRRVKSTNDTPAAAAPI